MLGGQTRNGGYTRCRQGRCEGTHGVWRFGQPPSLAGAPPPPLLPADSEPEVSASAYAAARDYWPATFQGASTAQEQGVMQGLRATRPVLVRGYESMVMVSARAAGAGGVTRPPRRAVTRTGL